MKENYAPGVMVYYSCLSGDKMECNESVRCGDDGNWDVTNGCVPYCKVIKGENPE